MVAVMIYLGSSYLVHSSHTPEHFLKDLDNLNPEIRWRGAHDLAQVLKRPESLALASNPKTPQPVAMGFVSQLHDSDMLSLMKSKDVPAVISTHARRMLTKKGKL